MTNKKNEIIIHEENKDSMSLPVIQWEGQRVITLQQVAEVHGIEFESVRRSFKNNQNKRFTPSVHYLNLMGKWTQLLAGRQYGMSFQIGKILRKSS